ncbi:MAG: peptidoglycan editing factor PgeF [Bacilli bacterium]|jgi:hypothetical protein|nr:peptidoglycan editing factor PgeF [Bacilli bacterium]MDD3389361.1 peptidoglycan editing factor PgeF [Bacilli bacterium]MDD4344871.1 peptidoglycan editing factor PgeF [Bacilli bacterium]MDD4521253.1 peptidoglycan editing factor PgeF [Bacilli bacterium]MDY0399897.1 peptidoglycan editing factor PgeF [Bacilli bacterium]
MLFKQWNRFPNDIVACTSTRAGGVSGGVYQSLNLALHVGDQLEAVSENRERFRKALNLKSSQIVFTFQNHGVDMLEATKDDGGKGYADLEDGLKADGLYTKEKNLAVAIQHADCVPIFFYIPKKRIVGIIHAGFPGTLKSATKVMLTELMKKEKVAPQDIYCNIGPALTFSHKLITLETRAEIASSGESFHFALKAVGDENYFDTPLMNFIQLRELGIPVDQIDYGGECVYEHSDKYFSVARDGSKSGRMISLIYQK